MRKLVVAVAVILTVTGGSSALGAGGVTVTPGDLSFGTVATVDSPTRQETITNTSGGDVIITLDPGSNNAFAVVNDTCSGTLGDTQTCSFDVRYSPTSPGGDSSTLTVDEGVAGTDTFALSGSAVANRFHFTSGSGSFGPVAIGDTAAPKQFTVENQTSFDADPKAKITGSDAPDFNLSGCGSSVHGGDTCTANVTFGPSSVGPESATLQIDGDSVALSGTGVDQVTVQPTDITFPDQHVGTNSTPQPVTVTNNRNQAINVNVNNGNPTDYNVDASDCGNQLGAGQSCTVNVTFSPNAMGTQPGTFTVVGQTVTLSGRGTAATANASPGSISFGNQPVFTESATQSVTVRNNGNEPMTMGVPALTGPGFDQFAISDGCQPISPIPPAGQCSIDVKFAPSSQGAQDAVLEINTSATNGQQTVQLHGTGTPSPIVFFPGPAPFKRPHHAGTFSTPKLITLTNKTSGPLTISAVHLGGLNPRSFRITAGNCAAKTLAADGSCTEKVRFAPNDVGLKSASLVVDDDGPNGPHSVQLTGRATYPKDDVAVHGAVGCDATKITWRRGSSSRRLDSTVIVRSRTHIPTGPNDGTRLPHGAGVLHDRGLRHFTAYDYRVFALYRSHTRPGTFNHSRGIILRLRTGEICTPMDGAVIGDTTPTVSWLRHATIFGYSFRLFHGGEEVQKPRFVHSTSFTFTGRRRLHHGFTYTLFLYAYPASQPEGTSIGRTTFRVR